MEKSSRLLSRKNSWIIYRWRFVGNHQEKVLEKVEKERLEENNAQRKREQKRMFLVEIRPVEEEENIR
jgi:hypothetical protein